MEENKVESEVSVVKWLKAVFNSKVIETLPYHRYIT